MAKKKNPVSEVTIDNIGELLLRRAKEFETNPELYKAQMESVGGNPITLGPRVTDAASWAKDQVEAAKNKAQKWLDKSQRPKKVPSQAALAANAKRIDNLNKSLADKTWEGAMSKVDEDVRLQVITAVGASGFAQGVERHKIKVERKVAKLQPLVLALAQTLDGMPVGTDADREAKMIAAKRGMQAIGKSLKTS